MIEDDKRFLKKQPIQSTSDDWKLTQFKMQLALGTTSAVAKKIYDISNTHVSSAFNSYAKGSIVLESFIQAQNLVQPNKLQKIFQKGFEIPKGGMIFNIGYNRKLNLKSKKQFSFVLSKVAVGKSYCYPLKKYRQSPIECPQGFESIYLYQQEQNPQVFMHQYVIFKNYQVYPNFLIEFVVDTYQQQQIKHPLCQNCVKIPPQQAKFYCITQQAHFCYQCDSQYHNSKLSSKHIRVQISQKPKKFGQCQIHDGVKLQLYCKTCAQALCVNCKISGDHASGQMAQHALTKLKQAYNDISSKMKQIDPNIERRKNQLTEDLSKIDLKIKQVNTKATHIQQQLCALFQKALNQLQYQTQKKLSFLIGDQLQLKRQYDHILWMESFLKYQLQVQEPNQFLKSWYKYAKYKKQVLSLSNLSINTQVKADMRLQGNIHVVVDGNKKRAQNHMTNSVVPNKEELMIPLSQSPMKQGRNIDRQLGSTQLRKTIFKKHYLDKMKGIGTQPGILKGSLPDSNRQIQFK